MLAHLQLVDWWDRGCRGGNRPHPMPRTGAGFPPGRMSPRGSGPRRHRQSNRTEQQRAQGAGKSAAMSQRGSRGLPSSQRRCNIPNGRASNTCKGTKETLSKKNLVILLYFNYQFGSWCQWSKEKSRDSYFLSVSQPKVMFPTMSMTPRIDIRKAALCWLRPFPRAYGTR